MSKVYFVDANAGQQSRKHKECDGQGCLTCGGTGRHFEIAPPEALPLAFLRLVEVSGFLDLIGVDDRVAIKIHSGEHFNHRLVPPVFYEVLVRQIVELGGKPFLTDTNTVYGETRYEGLGHYITAWRNGYDLCYAGAPFVVADGLVGTDATKIEIEGDVLKEVYVPSAIYESEVLISIDHTTIHPQFGLGANVKNLGMGAVAKQTKIQIHRHEIPAFLSEKCKGCECCLKVCSAGAIRMVNHKAVLDPSACWGCKLCLHACPHEAIILENLNHDDEYKALADGAMGVLDRFPGKFLAINFLMNITLDCDCEEKQGRPVVPDLGIMASTDIVAIDQASLDMIHSAPLYPLSVVSDLPKGSDLARLRRSKPSSFGMEQMLEYMESKGIGSRQYELIRLKRHKNSFKERSHFIPELGYARRLRERARKKSASKS